MQFRSDQLPQTFSDVQKRILLLFQFEHFHFRYCYKIMFFFNSSHVIFGFMHGQNSQNPDHRYTYPDPAVRRAQIKVKFQANCRNKFQAILKFIEPFHFHFCGRKFRIKRGKKKKPYSGNTLSGIRNTEHQLAKYQKDYYVSIIATGLGASLLTVHLVKTVPCNPTGSI